MNLYKHKIEFLFTVACLISQFIVAELSFTQIKYLHTVINQKFDYLSVLVGFSWWRTHTIENMYRYGNDQDATIQLLKELFHLQADDVTFDVTVLASKPAKYFNATIIGTIVGMLELYKDETPEGFQIKLDDFKTKLLKEIRKHFNAGQIAAQAKEKIVKEEKKKTELESEIKNAQNTLLELSNNSEYKFLDKQLQALNKQSRASETELNKIRKRIKEKSLSKQDAEKMYSALKENLDTTSLEELGFSQDEVNKIVKLQPEIEKYKKSIQELKAAKTLLEDPTILKTIATSKKELHAIESLLRKESVDATALNKELTNLVSLIAQTHIESLDNKYVPHMPQIILSAFLWKKANAKDKSEFKEYYNQVAQIAHIPLVNEYPPDWNSEYTFQEYESLKEQIEDAVSSDNIESFLIGQGYEQLTFALAGYQFWDSPFPAFITSIATTYDFAGTKYDFTNCVEASILNFIIAMLANDTKTVIDLHVLDSVAQKEGVKINPTLKAFLAAHQNLAFMQTKQNQDAWNAVIQNLDEIVYIEPITELPEYRFYEIKTALRNILSVFNHLFFGSSPDFNTLPVEERLNRLCSIFSREEFTVTWNVANEEDNNIVNTIDVNKLHYKNVSPVPALTINFEVEKDQSTIFQWNLEESHSFVSLALGEQQRSIEKSIGLLLLQNKLDNTALLSLFSWVARSLPLHNVINQINTNKLSRAYIVAVIFMQSLVRNEQKLEIITLLLSASSTNKTIISIIQKLMTNLPDDPVYNDQLYLIIHNYNIESLYKNLKSNRSSQIELLSKAIQHGYFDFIKQEIDSGFDLNTQGANKRTLLHFAVMYGNKDIAQLLLGKGATVDARNGNLETPLHIAISQGNKDIAQLFIEHGADVNALDHANETPLHRAVRKNNKDIVELLLNKGVLVNLQNNAQDTPLHIAAFKKNKDIVKLLLDHGADITLKNSDQETPRDIAYRQGNNDIVTLFDKK